MTALDAAMRYRPLPTDRPADDVERELLERWARDGLFARTLAAREGRPEFVFFEGPPTANGKPGIHHVFSRTVKDLFCRYRAMRGFHVARRAGWDTHGLPVEIEVENSWASAASSRSKRSVSRSSTLSAARACGGTRRTGRS